MITLRLKNTNDVFYTLKFVGSVSKWQYMRDHREWILSSHIKQVIRNDFSVMI